MHSLLTFYVKRGSWAQIEQSPDHRARDWRLKFPPESYPHPGGGAPLRLALQRDSDYPARMPPEAEIDHLFKLVSSLDSAHSVNQVIWIPSLGWDHTSNNYFSLNAADIEKWVGIYENLFSQLFGGATTRGFLSTKFFTKLLPEKSESEIRDLFKEFTVYRGVWSEEGATEERLEKLKSAVEGEGKNWTRELRPLLDREEDEYWVREGLILVESNVNTLRIKRWHLMLIVRTIQQMGIELKQREIVMKYDHWFWRWRAEWTNGKIVSWRFLV